MRAADGIHRFFFFAPGISAVSWTVLRQISRSRPLRRSLARVVHLDGDVIECGVLWGRSIIPLAMELKHGYRSEKTVFALDSFDGFRDEAVTTSDVGVNRTLAMIRSRFKQDPGIVAGLRRIAERHALNLQVVPGFFEETLPAVVEGRHFCLVHLDCDIYASYQACLPLLYPRVVPGGIIVFDEYRTPFWPGATQAIDEFFANKPEKPVRISDPTRRKGSRYAIVKLLPSPTSPLPSMGPAGFEPAHFGL